MESHVPGSVLFGCELTASTKSYMFQVDEEDDSDHILALSMVCLTDGAKDECNVVEVVGRNHENQEIAVPVANLKLSCQPLLSLDNFKLQPPVTFRLAAGSGPVHLSGWHRIAAGCHHSPVRPPSSWDTASCHKLLFELLQCSLGCSALGCRGKMLPLRRTMTCLTRRRRRRSFLLSSQPRSRGGNSDLRYSLGLLSPDDVYLRHLLPEPQRLVLCFYFCFFLL
ncbi:nucleoplasmin-3 isoform X2 [Strigops habroptila]|uniref:nucleoplasmin-3 isoform X2 n=1 Tax=Strigops habroptila TaxID=2489341 RepID=UPI0011CFFE7F|nr:nucleoplasmin-3 isoform X2 [Strigops habroptila]